MTSKTSHYFKVRKNAQKSQRRGTIINNFNPPTHFLIITCRFAISKLPIFLHKFDIGALQKQYLHVLMRIGKNGYSNHMDLRPAYVRFFHLGTIINLVFNQRFRVMVRKRKKIQPFEKSSSIILTSTHDLSFSYLLQIVQFSQPFI